MKRLIDLPCTEARDHFLKSSSYFNGDFPKYICFEKILKDVAGVLNGGNFNQFKSSNPSNVSNVNYTFLANKDGRFAWRPLELFHPAIYVSLVNVITEDKNWMVIQRRMGEFDGGVVECCSAPVIAVDHYSDAATQVKSWWQKVEQRSLAYSLEYNHLLHTDVTDCYGTLYTHSIAWAIHGLDAAKENRTKNSLLGNKIDFHIQSGRYGQTNGIAQGSILMDFIAEIVLGYVDSLINSELIESRNIRILRYRDDYRIFSNSADQGETVLRIVSDMLRSVGMKLGVTKTISCNNIVEGSIKPDKLAGIELQDLGNTNAKTIQKQLLRLHGFGQKFPNSGTLRKLVSEFHTTISEQKETPDDLDVQVAIATDIAFVSPTTFPAIAGILSHLIALAPPENKPVLWEKVRKKMGRVPYNGYLEIWLQRVTKPKKLNINFTSKEPICQIVNGESPQLWECNWISNHELIEAMSVKKLVVADASESEETIKPKEVALFRRNSWYY